MLTLPVARVTVSPGQAVLPVGTSTQLSAAAYDQANRLMPEATFTWRSSNPVVADVTTSGIVVAFAEGAGFGMSWTFILRRAQSLATPAEQERTASALPTMQRFGFALGAAYIGIVANAAGFADIELTPLEAGMWFGNDAGDASGFVLGLMGWMLEGLDDSGRARALDNLRATVGSVRTANLQAPLRKLAAETGGLAFLNSNRFDEELDRLAQDVGSYYSLGFRPFVRGVRRMVSGHFYDSRDATSPQ